ncbi:MAG: sigma-70 family RNA polymerase sigma factor [Deltaproteobacteria bacterium]|nr:sigma-70 family RNA polymerase sigma factor [Deltaproteobacteria bacterium]
MHTTGDASPPVALAVPSFAEIYRDNAAFIWRALRRLGVRDADVEDVCQEVFLVVHRKLGEFAQRSSLRTWLYAIALRCASDHRRRAHVKREATSSAPVDAPIEAPQPTHVADRQARAVLDEILDTLDEPKRVVFVLYELEELTMAEVAEAVGCPLQTAYSRLHAAREVFEAAVKRRQAKERAS